MSVCYYKYLRLSYESTEIFFNAFDVFLMFSSQLSLFHISCVCLCVWIFISSHQQSQFYFCLVRKWFWSFKLSCIFGCFFSISVPFVKANVFLGRSLFSLFVFGSFFFVFSLVFPVLFRRCLLCVEMPMLMHEMYRFLWKFQFEWHLCVFFYFYFW